MSDRLCLWLATGFGSGRARVAPGTCGTAVALVLTWLLSFTGWHALAVLGALALVATAISLAIGSRVERLLGRTDPSEFVLDEFAGYFVAVLPVDSAWSAWPAWPELVVAFLLFRVFDIIKPPPARRLQELHGGPGIVLDDLVAGAYALLGVLAFRHWS